MLQWKRIRIVLYVVSQRFGIEPETDDLRTGEEESIHYFPPLLLIGSGIMSLSVCMGKLWFE